MDYEPTIARRASDKTLRHVTIRQIKEAEQIHETAPLTIEGTEISSLMVVANICECNSSADGADLRFELDDGTGRLACRLRGQPVEWVFENFAYVRVILKQCRIRTVFEATYLNTVLDHYEIFYHSLKVIQDSLLYRKGGPSVTPKPAGAGDAEATFSEVGTTSLQSASPANDNGDGFLYGNRRRPNSNADLGTRIFEQEDGFMASTEPSSSRTVSHTSTTSYHTAYSRSPSPESPPVHHHNIPYQSQFQYRTPERNLYGPAALALRTTEQSLPTPHRRMNDPYGHLSNLQRDIILCTNNALERMRSRTPRSEWDNGVNIEEIMNRLEAKYTSRLTVADISDNIEFLINEGYIFTTFDDAHYNVTLAV
ncbi:hypothetical protein M378DRAFT_704983 [Amanita muscaria Koide BX008]|uniref:Replication protein A C-terminal domain-containing protein n=1 Tax=Amanita muscaria (strain Koide BX008) TaxID=946122 RepID=A0A0C2X660_AMAMK|nr:hypothetical protein M378DRAFT_704983 [Amanita muscaria Koide BX008]